jgi:mono/diheme cytochrome c family protein
MKLICARTLFGALAGLSLAGLSIGGLSIAVGATNETSAVTGDVTNGKRLFLADGCRYCHGTTGAGGGIAGPRIAPNPLSLEGVKAKVRTASGRMPVYSSAVLSDAELADIVAYLESIPTGQEAKDIPLLNK